MEVQCCWFRGMATVCLVILLAGVCWGEPISCKNEGGEPVDWFVIYKLPRLRESPDVVLQKGLGYTYLDSQDQQWRQGSGSINSSGAVKATLDQVYASHGAKDILYVLYNDETPEKNESAAHGHTKGDLCFDQYQGFWLVHSVPRFPDYARSQYSYPDSGTWFGQTFLCMTLPYKALDAVGLQLQYNHPQVYDYQLPASFSTENPNLRKVLVDDLHVKSAPWQHQTVLRTLGAQDFISFAKYNKFDADLYDSLVAPVLGADLQVESWRNGGHVMPTNCSGKFKVYNIQGVDINGNPFSETVDHSKWAVTVDTKKPWVCIGDINRMQSQKFRGGGTVCVHLPQVWQAFSAAVTKVEMCPDIP